MAGHVAVDVDGREHEHAEHVVAVGGEARAGLVVVLGRPAQPARVGRVELDGHGRVDRTDVGIGEVDPPFGSGHGFTIRA